MTASAASNKTDNPLRYSEPSTFSVAGRCEGLLHHHRGRSSTNEDCHARKEAIYPENQEYHHSRCRFEA
jgi:hypothetical protein